MAGTRGLNRHFLPLARYIYALAKSLDTRFVITSGYRSPAAQAALYARFLRGEPGLYTVAPPGRSQHERGFAIDIARVGVKALEDPLLVQLGTWWRQQGGVWGGAADPVHFEAPKSWTGRA